MYSLGEDQFLADLHFLRNLETKKICRVVRVVKEQFVTELALGLLLCRRLKR